MASSISAYIAMWDAKSAAAEEKRQVKRLELAAEERENEYDENVKEDEKTKIMWQQIGQVYSLTNTINFK